MHKTTRIPLSRRVPAPVTAEDEIRDLLQAEIEAGRPPSSTRQLRERFGGGSYSRLGRIRHAVLVEAGVIVKDEPAAPAPADPAERQVLLEARLANLEAVIIRELGGVGVVLQKLVTEPFTNILWRAIDRQSDRLGKRLDALASLDPVATLRVAHANRFSKIDAALITVSEQIEEVRTSIPPAQPRPVTTIPDVDLSPLTGRLDSIEQALGFTTQLVVLQDQVVELQGQLLDRDRRLSEAQAEALQLRTAIQLATQEQARKAAARKRRRKLVAKAKAVAKGSAKKSVKDRRKPKLTRSPAKRSLVKPKTKRARATKAGGRARPKPKPRSPNKVVPKVPGRKKHHIPVRRATRPPRPAAGRRGRG